MGQELVLRQGIESGVEMLTLNRPDKLNALSTPLVRALEAHLDAIAADRSVRAVIITGAGERAFVAGADIAEYRGRQSRAFIDYQRESRRVFCKIENLPQPVIAAVRGYALGGGFEIALCCDIIICAASARLGLPEGLLGLSPGGGGTQRLTRCVGKVVASDIMLAHRRITGERAHALGLAAECVPDDALMETALERARAVVAVAPLAAEEMKAAIRAAAETPLEAGLTLEQTLLYRLYNTDDAEEGINAFLEKRQPVFTGR
ncbi:enoyl-CoA hydratase/isomerase family protein [Paracoccus sp. (in: a-proteobacteria)]|uniref:enoyl-CoA hydratase/isomerase family protein n=1 Tax=Paracoccus sp. TaxID=267 RepID=UPI0035B0DAB1